MSPDTSWHVSIAELVYRKICSYAQLDAIDDFCRRHRKSFDTVAEEDDEDEDNEDEDNEEEGYEDDEQ